MPGMLCEIPGFRAAVPLYLRHPLRFLIENIPLNIWCRRGPATHCDKVLSSAGGCRRRWTGRSRCRYQGCGDLDGIRRGAVSAIRVPRWTRVCEPSRQEALARPL